MKKKILFMVINMNVGGTEKALLNMIARLPEEKFDVTVLMLEKYGGFLEHIPNYVYIDYLINYQEIKKQFMEPPKVTIIEKIRSRRLIQAFYLIILYLLTKISKDRSIYYKYLLKDSPSMKTEYDLAVAYAGPMDLISYFIVHKVKAKRKVQWIHFDIDKIGFNKRFAANLYKKFDKLFTVSKESKEKVIQALPNMAYKTEVFNNIISTDLITTAAKKGKGFQDDFTGIRILTVGRLSMEKGQDMAIRVLSRLIEDGIDVRWYCLGTGTAKKSYETMIDEYNVRSSFFILGEDPNPYHYMKHCDIYVQPSRHEGYCITLAEARALHKPIVTTDFTGAKEQIVNNKTGFIVNINEDELYEAVKKLIYNRRLRHEFQNNLKREIAIKEDEMKGIYTLV